MVFTTSVNEASPHILEGLKNFLQPDVTMVCRELRHYHARHGEHLRKDAPAVVAKAASWVLANADRICDDLEAGVARLPMSRPMLKEAFRNCLERWTNAGDLMALVKAETIGLPSAKPHYPQVVFHNLAGNLFVSGWESLTESMLLGACSIVRCSQLDPVFPAIWAYALGLANPMFRDAIAICEWDARDLERGRLASTESDAVVVYGADDTVNALKESVPWNKPYAGHGSTFSFALISRGDIQNGGLERLADCCAYDFIVYDQQGCLSPRAMFVEDHDERYVDRFVDAVYLAMKRWENDLPRQRLLLEDQAALARARDEVLLDAACGGTGRMVSRTDDKFLVTVKPVEQFKLGPVNRYLDMYLYKEPVEVVRALSDYRGHLSTLGVAEPRKLNLIGSEELLISRVCELGSMQVPHLGWCLDGYRPLQKLFRFQTVQTS